MAASPVNRLPSFLQNHYFALRHGQSLANVAHKICSNPDIACHAFGLSVIGQEQALAAAQDVVTQFQHRKLAIFSSDLLRAKQTAEIVFQHAKAAKVPIHQDQVVLDTRLRERWFGDWDETSDINYEEVWKDDVRDSSHTFGGVESVDSVMERATQCIAEIDAQLENYMVVVVAHGDVLQILQTAFCKLDGTHHRSLEHLETARLRPLILKNT